MKVNPFKPVAVEDILDEEFRKNEMAEAEMHDVHAEIRTKP